MVKQYDQELGDKQWQAVFYSADGESEPIESNWYQMNLLDVEKVGEEAKKSGFDCFEIVTQTTDIIRYSVE